MSKQNAAVEKSATKLQTKPQPTVESSVGMAEFADKSLLGGNNLPAVQLGDLRFSAIQRQILAGQLGKMQGNGHLQQTMAFLKRDKLDEPYQLNTYVKSTSIVQPQSYKQQAGVQCSPSNFIQRESKIDGAAFSTFADLTVWYSIRLTRLTSQQTEMKTDNVPAPVVLQVAIDESKKNTEECMSRGAAPVDMGAAIKAQIWFDFKYVTAMNEAESEKAKVAAARMKDTEKKVQAAQTQLETVILPTLRDQQRASFRKSDDNSLLTLADTIATVLDTALVTKDTLLALNAERAIIENMINVAQGHKGVFPSANSRAPAILECAEKVNKVYAAFQLVRSGIDLFTNKKTTAAGGSAGVSALATVVSAGGTLLNASAGMTLYANLYIGPMVNACLAGIEKISDLRSKTDNRAYIELGEFDLVNWSIEPGGRPVFNFMLTVMKAGDESGVSTPIPKTVANYFVENESDFNAGISGKNKMPTKGFWFLEEIDQAKIGRWVFRNRSNLWGMLYGAANVPV